MADIRIAYFGQVALEGGAVSLQPTLVELPGLLISIGPSLLSVEGGTARLHFTVSGESLCFEADTVFEIFERNRGRVSWRAHFQAATPITLPLTIQANDYGFDHPATSYDVVVRARGRGRLANAVLTAWVTHERGQTTQAV